MTDRQRMIDALNAVHSFPGSYTYKIIGEPDGVTTEKIGLVLTKFLGQGVQAKYSHRLSKEGKHASVTVRVVVPHAEMAADIHEAMVALSGVKYVL